MLIEPNIPIPDKDERYPFKYMKVGDSFFCERPTNTVLNAAGASARKYKTKFTTRAVYEHGCAGTRCWRIK